MKEAEKQVREAVGFDDAETVSVHKLEKMLSLPAVKEHENTPDDMRKVFNTK